MSSSLYSRRNTSLSAASSNASLNHFTAATTRNDATTSNNSNHSKVLFVQQPPSLHNNSAPITEGWLELFLTPSEKAHFALWHEVVKDTSLTHRLLRPFVASLVRHIPDTIAPNVLTLAGCLGLGQAWYLTHLYGEDHPVTCTYLAAVHIGFFFLTNSVDRVHADRLRQRTALGELFQYSCDSCATIFLTLLTTYCCLGDRGGGDDIKLQWYAVQASQLVLFLKHLSAFHRHAGLRYYVLMGPGEVILTSIVLLLLRATGGLHVLYVWMLEWTRPWWNAMHGMVLFNTTTSTTINDDDAANVVALEVVLIIYYTLYVAAVTRCLMLEDGWSRFGLSASLLMRFLPAILLHFGVLAYELKVVDVVCDGLFMAVLTSDVTLAKMAGRQIHPWVVLMSMAAVLSHPTILALVLVYYIAVFADLCSYLNMPLLTTCRNVYCDGVFDLCHIGHKMLFQKALSFGNRLFVGVVGDEDASHYKRPPIMTAAERCAEVEACKAVTKVIPNAPCFGLTQEFLNQHDIHVVAFGEEYLERYPDPKDDPYYGLPRQLGIARPLPRTKGLSTSDLIRRIQAAQPADEKKSPT